MGINIKSKISNITQFHCMIYCYLKLCLKIKRMKASSCKPELAEYSLRTLYLTNCKTSFVVQPSFKSLQLFARYICCFCESQFLNSCLLLRAAERWRTSSRVRSVILLFLNMGQGFFAYAQGSCSRQVPRLYWTQSMKKILYRSTDGEMMVLD